MKPLHALIIGCFMIGAAHYVRDGANVGYALWCILGCVVGLYAEARERAALIARQTSAHRETIS